MIFGERLSGIDPGRERSFLFGTLRRTASTYRRSRRREAGSEPLEHLAATLPPPDELLDEKRRRELLDALLLKLDEDLRDVLVLTEVEGLTQPQIAELLGVPVGTVASRIRRAREAFAGLLEKLEKRRRRDERAP